MPSCSSFSSSLFIQPWQRWRPTRFYGRDHPCPWIYTLHPDHAIRCLFQEAGMRTLPVTPFHYSCDSCPSSKVATCSGYHSSIPSTLRQPQDWFHVCPRRHESYGCWSGLGYGRQAELLAIPFRVSNLPGFTSKRCTKTQTEVFHYLTSTSLIRWRSNRIATRSHPLDHSRSTPYHRCPQSCKPSSKWTSYPILCFRIECLC